MAKKYGWDVPTIAGMSPYQQLKMLSDKEDESETIGFRTEKEYEEWRTARGLL